MSRNIYSAFQLAIQARDDICPKETPAAHASLDQAILAMLPDMAPDRSILRNILFSGSKALLEGLFARHPGGFYATLQANPETEIPLLGLFSDGRVDLLQILHKHGMNTLGKPEAVHVSVRSQPRPEVVEYILAIDGFSTVFTPRNLTHLVQASVGEAGHCISRHFTAASPEIQSEIVASLIAACRPVPQMKSLAVALHSGANLEDISQVKAPGWAAPLRPLVEQSGTAQGRAALRAMEPSLEHILARPSTDLFFGLADKDFA